MFLWASDLFKMELKIVTPSFKIIPVMYMFLLSQQLIYESSWIRWKEILMLYEMWLENICLVSVLLNQLVHWGCVVLWHTDIWPHCMMPKSSLTSGIFVIQCTVNVTHKWLGQTCICLTCTLSPVIWVITKSQFFVLSWVVLPCVFLREQLGNSSQWLTVLFRREILWAEGCSEQYNCSATATMCCEPVSCPKGESCTLNNTWSYAGKGKTSWFYWVV